jgi:hypothetical protein
MERTWELTPIARALPYLVAWGFIILFSHFGLWRKNLILDLGNPSSGNCFNCFGLHYWYIRCFGQGMYSLVYETSLAEFFCVNEVAMALNLTGNECVCFFSLLFCS